MAAPPAAPGSVSSPWWAGPIFHYVTGLTALLFALLFLHFGGDPAIADGAFIGGFGFLGVGVGVSASSGAS